MRLKILAAAGLSVLLAACATTVPALPPVLTYERADCASTPDLASAISLVPEKDKAIWTLDNPVGQDTPCLTHHDASVPYLVYALPPASSARMVEVGSALEFARLFSPDVVLLDGEGAVSRSFEQDQYMFRPGIYSVQFTPLENERFVLVTSNPARVGDQYDSITGGTASTYIYTGYGGTNWRSGNEAHMTRGFSHEGTVRANVYRPEKD